MLIVIHKLKFEMKLEMLKKLDSVIYRFKNR